MLQQQQRTTVTSPDGRTAFLVIFFAILLHISLIWLPGINLEWVFAGAAKYFDDHNPVLLNHYFSLEANTLGIPLLGYLAHHVLPFLSYAAVLRLLSASSFVLLGYSLLKLHSLLGQDYNPAILLAVVFLNPLIWVFGGRGTADLFPAALTLFAVALFWQPGSSPVRLVFAIATYGIAITLKYHAALLLPLIAWEMLKRPEVKVRQALFRFSFIAALILAIPAVYVLLVKHLYGFWFVPAKFRAIHEINLTPAAIVMNLISYAAYLCLLLLPYSIIVIWSKFTSIYKRTIMTGAAIGLFILGMSVLRVETEMQFGPLDKYITPRIYGGCFLVFAGIFVLASREVLRATSTAASRRYLECIFVGLSICIVILSLTRPAQRYLLFVLPLSYVCVMDKDRTNKYITAVAASFYAVLILFITLNQVATGAVARKMVQQIAARGLLNDTDPGDVIRGAEGDRFPDQVNGAPQKQYTVIAGTNPNAIVTVDSHPAPMVHKILSLVRYKDAPMLLNKRK